MNEMRSSASRGLELSGGAGRARVRKKLIFLFTYSFFQLRRYSRQGAMEEARYIFRVFIMSTFLLRRDRHALQQLTAAITHGQEPRVDGCAEAAAVMNAWRTLEASNQSAKSRIGELERELEAAREQMREAAVSAATQEVRFDLASRASSEGLWEVEIIAGDPHNAGNRY